MIKNILAIRNDRFGEFLLNIPAFRALKEAYPGARLTLAVSPAVKELAECLKCSDQVVAWGSDFKKSLRKQGFDLCVVLNPAKEAHWAVFLAKIPKRVGYNRKWGCLLTHRLKDTKYLGNRHEVDCNLELVGLIGAKTNDVTISLGKLPAYNKPGHPGAIAVHPFTSDSLKQWPIERFKQLAKSLSGRSGVKILIIGKEEGRCREEFENLGENIINLVNQTSLVELAQVLKQCKLLVTGDSGPMHLAAAVGTPVVALFRNDLPGKTAQRWGPRGKGHLVIERANLAEIGVEDVLIAVENKMLNFPFEKAL